MNPSIKSIHELVRKQETNYIIGNTKISKYVNHNMYETIEKVDAYVNSKHISGETDSMGRDKPFFNIVNAAVNIWYRATDIDRKDIRIIPSKAQDTLGAFLATIHLQEWMRRERFGVVLNEWGHTLAKYGSAVLKFVEQEGKLKVNVVSWNRLISDSIDFNNNVKIEVLEMTPAQLLQQKGYNQDVVRDVLDTIQARQLLNKERQDNKNDYIKLYEVHGMLPLSLLTGKKADDNIYTQQMHVITYIVKGNAKARGVKEYDDYTLIKGKEDKDPYFITSLIEEDGRTLGIGAVEHLFEAQWMQNHSVKAIKDQLDLASKLIFQTADPAFIGANALNAIENGDILIHKDNQPITQVQNNSHDITSLQSFSNQWKALGQELTSTPDALQGKTPPSNIAYGTVAATLQESHSLFEIMTQNKGLAIEDMLRLYIIPYLKKQMNTSDEIAATLSAHDITKVDTMYVNSEAIRRGNKQITDQIFNNELATPPDTNAIKGQIQGELSQQGSQRFFTPKDVSTSTWKEVFKDLQWDVICDITGESINKQEVMQTLSTMLQTIARNPAVLSDPNAKLLFNKILDATGEISPMELAATPAPLATPQANKTSSTSINYKDLPPNLQPQLAQQAVLTDSQNGG